MSGLDTEEGAGVQPFRKLGELVLGNVCPRVSRELAANMRTPLMKNATGNDARPASAKDCDYAAWMNRYTGQLPILLVRWYVPSSFGSGSQPVSSSKIYPLEFG
jgi:hypothetical protein